MAATDMSQNNKFANEPMIADNDVKYWTNTAERALSDTNMWMAPAGPDAREFETSLFGCFNPIETCMYKLLAPVHDDQAD